MAAGREIASLLVVLLGFGGALLSADAIPQGYQSRYRRGHRCPTCPGDCSEKLSGGQAEAAKDYALAQARYTAAAPAVQPSYRPHPTPAPYAASLAQPQVQYSGPPARAYQAAYRAAPTPYPAWNYPNPNLDPYDCPGYDCDYGCRCGRSLGGDEDYAAFARYNRRSRDASERFEPSERDRQEPLPFADESAPPANFYKNYRPYARDRSDSPDDQSEEQPSRRSSSAEAERLFVVYRADEYEDNPSDSQLDSVIRQAMDVARQQRTQEEFALGARKARYRYEHDKYRDNQRVDFRALKDANDDDAGGEARFDLSPGPLMNAEESYVTEEGDDDLNPGLDQTKWTLVPSLNDMESIKAQQSDAIEEIEAAVSVVPDAPRIKLNKLPKILQKTNDVADAKDKAKKETIQVVRPDDFQNKSQMPTELVEDIMQTPSIVTESTHFEKLIETTPVTSAPTTDPSLT